MTLISPSSSFSLILVLTFPFPSLSISSGRSLTNIPASERPKAKPFRKIDGKGDKNSKLQQVRRREGDGGR